MRLTSLLLVLLAVSGSLSSCNSSTAYNPALNLPGRPMKKDNFHLSGGVGVMPQARPSAAARNFDYGVQGMARYGFHDRFALSFDLWRTLNTDDGDQWGINSYAMLRLDSFSSGMSSAIVPMFTMCYVGRTIEGQGIALWYAVWPPAIENISSYLGLAPFFGWYAPDVSHYGYGVIMNGGVVFDLSDQLNLGVEVAGVMQVSEYDQDIRFVPAPSLTLSWKVQ